jgi:hypothetical protein
MTEATPIHPIGWSFYQPQPGSEADAHVVPDNDVHQHVLSESCPCRPEEDLEAYYPVFKHRAYDQRECYELGHRKPH